MHDLDRRSFSPALPPRLRDRLLTRLRYVAILLSLGLTLSWPGWSLAAVVYLNEYNAVSGSNFLNGGTLTADEDGGLASDLYLGRVEGNGGDWFELVLTDDGVDLRGWQLEISVEGVLETTLFFSQDILWTQLQAGTIITVSEDQLEDVSYDPASGDWWINVRADSGASGAYITASSFAVNNDDWQLTIKDASGEVIFGPGGEGIGGTGSVNSREIYRLEENPSGFIEATTLCYDDADSHSSFGAPNSWAGGAQVQDFVPLRTGGAPTSQCDETDLTPLAFDPTRLLQIEITMLPSDYELLRREQRTLMETFGGRCGDAPPPNPYNYYPADVTVDGTTVVNAGVRSKGFFGSASRAKPSFKIDFSEYGNELKVYGMERLTLNNLQQDPSFMDQCLGYGLFQDAGLVASRCSLAEVTLNGTSLGIYSNVESIKEPFLIRNYGNSTGKLYEGSLADFRPNWIGVFEKKNHNDSTDLEAIQAALEIEDDLESLTALSLLIDLDKYLTYWALDGLIGNWDGYSGNSNNFWVYKNPGTGLHEFLPWSLDDLFGRGNPFTGGGSESQTIFENSSISNRLWQIEGMSLQYQARINELIATIWDEAVLSDRIDQMEALITPVAGDISGPVADTRAWINGRAATVASEFSGGPPGDSSTLAGKNCLEIQGEISADFSTTYSDPIGTTPPAGSSFSVNSFEFSGSTVLSSLGVSLGPSEEFGTDLVALRLIGLTNFPQGLIFNIPIHEEDLVAAAAELTAVGDTIASMVLNLNLQNLQAIYPRGFVVDPLLQLDQVSLVPGGATEGTIQADLAAWVPHPVPEPSSGLLLAVGASGLVALGRRRFRQH
ncbi:MAG: CotH kinase family protein [Myxococcota bacterium]|nr:CotH kinase family protein [Myxococcota bacterium]